VSKDGSKPLELGFEQRVLKQVPRGRVRTLDEDVGTLAQLRLCKFGRFGLDQSSDGHLTAGGEVVRIVVELRRRSPGLTLRR